MTATCAISSSHRRIRRLDPIPHVLRGRQYHAVVFSGPEIAFARAALVNADAVQLPATVVLACSAAGTSWLSLSTDIDVRATRVLPLALCSHLLCPTPTSASTSGPASMPPVSDTPSPVAAHLRGGEGVEKAMGPPSPSPHIHLLRCVRLCRIHVNTPAHCLIHVPLLSIADGDEGDEGKAMRGRARTRRGGDGHRSCCRDRAFAASAVQGAPCALGRNPRAARAQPTPAPGRGADSDETTPTRGWAGAQGRPILLSTYFHNRHVPSATIHLFGLAQGRGGQGDAGNRVRRPCRAVWWWGDSEAATPRSSRSVGVGLEDDAPRRIRVRMEKGRGSRRHVPGPFGMQRTRKIAKTGKRREEETNGRCRTSPPTWCGGGAIRRRLPPQLSVHVDITVYRGKEDE
ncbi:hypothetical protein B0H14DRAFT_2590603 [Mycena olivaceomarginata]|nr:hypothetical protein B0H14DRAFT_2590603 [Mycena olivaceomarginata]